MEYDFVEMCLNLMGEIAANAMGLCGLAAFAFSSIASEAHSRYVALFSCLLLPAPMNQTIENMHFVKMVKPFKN